MTVTLTLTLLCSGTEEEASLFRFLVPQPQGGKYVPLRGTRDRDLGLYNPLPIQTAHTRDQTLGYMKCTVSDSTYRIVHTRSKVSRSSRRSVLKEEKEDSATIG